MGQGKRTVSDESESSSSQRTPGSYQQDTKVELGELSAVGLVALAGVVGRLLQQGTSGIRGAILIVVFSAATLLILHLPRVANRQRLAIAAAIVTTELLLTVPSIGRAPAPLALMSLTIADLAFFGVGTRRSSWRGERPGGLRSYVVLVLVAVAGICWLLVGSNLVVLAVLAAAAFVLAGRNHRLVAGVDRGLGRVASWTVLHSAGVDRRVWAFVARSGRLAAAGVASAMSSVARRVVGVVRATWRSVLSPSHRPLLWTFVIAAAVTAPIFYRTVDPTVLIRGTSDVPGTLERVRWMQFWPLRMPVPHPTWSVAMKLLSPLLGEVASVVLVLSCATGASAVVLVAVGRSFWDDRPRLGWSFATVFGLGYVLMENPASLAPQTDGWWSRYAFAGEWGRGQGFAPLHQWGTPTITLSMPLVFATFASLLQVISGIEQRSGRLNSYRRRLLVLVVLLTVTQPATTLALVPGVVVYLVVSHRLTRAMAKLLVPSFLIPGTVIVLAQVWFLASNVSPWEQATWKWRPFWVVSHFGIDRPAFAAVMLIVPLAVWALGRRYLSDPAVALSLCALAVSLGPFLLLEQTTIAGIPDGDLGVSVLMSIILLFLATLRSLLLELQAVWRRLVADGSAPSSVPAWCLPVIVLLVAVLGAGLVDLAAAAGIIGEI